MGTENFLTNIFKPDDDERELVNASPRRETPTEQAQHVSEKCFFVLVAIILFSVPVMAIAFLNIYVINNRDNVDINSVDNYIRSIRIQQHKIMEADKDNKVKLVCYYYFPTYDGSEELYPENIDPALCTHLIVGFVPVINSTIFVNETVQKSIPKIINLKETNDKIKILFSVGGADQSDGFSDMIINHKSRKLFIKSLVNLLHLYKFDGVDLDWEFPVTVMERRYFSQLLQEIRKEFVLENREYLLTVAVAAPEPIVTTSYNIREINLYVDFINLMSYDFHFYSKITPFTGFNSPLFARKDEMLYLSKLNINYSAELWVQLGMDRNKIIVGLPTYGHSFTLINKNNIKPGSPAEGYGKLGQNGWVNYREVCNFIKQNTDVNLKYDEEAFSPYVSLKKEWVSFEDKHSLKDKTRYIRKYEFGGAMLFSLNHDDYSGNCTNIFELTKFVNKVLFDDS